MKTRKNYNVYIGTGLCKYIDKEGTKQGAFFTVDTQVLKEALDKISDEQCKIFAVPNREGNLTLKININEQ